MIPQSGVLPFHVPSRVQQIGRKFYEAVEHIRGRFAQLGAAVWRSQKNDAPHGMFVLEIKHALKLVQGFRTAIDAI
jgi:hypothetical protein